MLDEVDLEAAAAKGILGEDQVIALRNFMAQKSGTPMASQERFQFLSSLADITRAIGFVLVLVGVPIAFRQTIEGDLGRAIVDLPYQNAVTLWFVYVGLWTAAIMMLVAGIFLYLRRYQDAIKANPATAAALMIGGSFVIASHVAVIAKILEPGSMPDPYDPHLPLLPIAVSVSAFLFAFWRMTRFPPTLAFACLGLILCQSAGFAGFWDRRAEDFTAINWLTILSAIPVFCLALWFDLTDVRRETYRGQVAFWLHIVAGAVFARAFFGLVSGRSWAQFDFFGISSFSGFLAIVACVAAASLISLALDRRAMLMSLAIPFAASLGVIGLVFMGGFLVVASYKWTVWRKRLLAKLPVGLVAQLPRTELAVAGQRPTRRHREMMPRRFRS